MLIVSDLHVKLTFQVSNMRPLSINNDKNVLLSEVALCVKFNL